MSVDFENLRTLEDVQDYLREGYRAAGDPHARKNQGHLLGYGFAWGRLPLSVAEPGPLIEHAVRLAGAEGLTLQQAEVVFDRLGQERFRRGLAFARDAGRVSERREPRLNRAGRLQGQVVLYAVDEHTAEEGD